METNSRAAIFHAVDQPLELRTIPWPTLQGSEYLIRITACTLCGSDLHSVHGRRKVPTPTVLGHEILGRIEAFGPAAPRTDFAGNALEIGDRVTWAIVASCGTCFYCQRGLSQKCEQQTKYGHEAVRPGYELTGGLADYCHLAPGTAIFRVPDDLPDAVACPANCATATVAGAMVLAGDLVGRTVLIMGAGMLGVTGMAWAKAHGAALVIGCDVDAERLRVAAAFGADRLVTPSELAEAVASCTTGHGVDIALEMTGSPEAFEAALPLTRMGGTIVLIGSVFPSRPVPLLLEQVVRRCLTLQGNHNYSPQDLQAALEFLARHHREFPFESLVTDWFPLTDVARAFEASSSRSLRIGIRESSS